MKVIVAKLENLGEFKFARDIHDVLKIGPKDKKKLSEIDASESDYRKLDKKMKELKEGFSLWESGTDYSDAEGVPMPSQKVKKAIELIDSLLEVIWGE